MPIGEDRVQKAFRQLKYMFILASVLICIVVGLYFYHFGMSRSFHENQSVWGAFGDYLGGILNPIIALFALWGIIQTIRLQGEDLKISADALAESSKSLNEQVKHIAQEKELNDLKQAVEHTEREINELLEQYYVPTQILLRDAIQKKGTILGRKTFISKHNAGEISTNDYQWHQVQQIIRLSIWFDRLARLLSQYEMTAGYSYFVSSVKSKYNIIVSEMFENHYLDDVGPYLLRIGDLPEVVDDSSKPMKLFKIH